MRNARPDITLLKRSPGRRLYLSDLSGTVLDPGNFPFRIHHYRRYPGGASRTVAARVYLFPGYPGNVRSQSFKIVKFGLNFTSWEVVILVTGMVVSFVVSILAIKFLMGYIKKHNFKVFGWYRIVLGIIVILFFTIFR